MKLNKHSQYYHQYFKNAKDKRKKFPNISYKNNVLVILNKNKNVYVPKISVLAKKLLRNAGLSNFSTIFSHDTRNINTRSKCQLYGEITIKGIIHQFSFADEFKVYFKMQGKSYYYTDNQIIQVFHARAIQDIDPQNIDYYTNDEALIFQYNTTFDYDRIRSIVHIIDSLTKQSVCTVMNIYQAVIKQR